MSAAWIIYFAGMSDKIGCSIGFMFFLSVVVFVIALFIYSVASPDYDKHVMEKAVKVIRWCIFPMVFLGILSISIPSEKTIYLMAGAKVTEDIVKSPEAKEIGGKILTIINDKLDEQVKEKK